MPEVEKKRPTGSYEVGYCRPPLHSRWAPGESGNKRDPEPECVDFWDSVMSVLERKVTLSIDGKRTRMTLAEALAQKLVQDALTGNASARRELFKQLESRPIGPMVIDAQLVFEEEEYRLGKMAEEILALRQEKTSGIRASHLGFQVIESMGR